MRTELLLEEYRATSCNQRLCRDPGEEKWAVIRFTTSKIWKRVKFINSDQMLNDVADKSLMEFVTQQLLVGLDGNLQVKKKWWDQHKELIRNTIKTQRSNVTSSLKTVFLGKWNNGVKSLTKHHISPPLCFSKVFYLVTKKIPIVTRPRRWRHHSP